MGYLRGLKPKQRAEVKKLRETGGLEMAIKKAKKLVS
jgi:hypothetical protein